MSTTLDPPPLKENYNKVLILIMSDDAIPSKLKSEEVLSNESRVERLKNALGNYPDFPKKGIIFRDLFPILQQPDLFEDLIDLIKNHIETEIPDVNGIIGLESRGFLIAPIIALTLNLPFIPIRKAGKLPGQIKKVNYSLEYGMDSLAQHVLDPKHKVKPMITIMLVFEDIH